MDYFIHYCLIYRLEKYGDIKCEAMRRIVGQPVLSLAGSIGDRFYRWRNECLSRLGRPRCTLFQWMVSNDIGFLGRKECQLLLQYMVSHVRRRVIRILRLYQWLVSNDMIFQGKKQRILTTVHGQQWIDSQANAYRVFDLHIIICNHVSRQIRFPWVSTFQKMLR